MERKRNRRRKGEKERKEWGEEEREEKSFEVGKYVKRSWKVKKKKRGRERVV